MLIDERTGCTCYDETTRRCVAHSGGGRGFVLKDSGERREFETGAVRDMESNKERPDLISPFAMMRVGRWMAMGAAKYGDRNWEKGMPMSVFYASLMRHLLKWAMGWRDEDHLAAVVFNAQALIHFEETGRAELDDMPRYDGRTTEGVERGA